MFHSHNPFRQRKTQTVPSTEDGLLRVPYKTFEDAKRAFPACEATALRAWTRSEAARYANALVRLPRWGRDFDNVVALFASTVSVAESAIRSRRVDFQFMLIKSGTFERRVAARLVREGSLLPRPNSKLKQANRESKPNDLAPASTQSGEAR